MRCQTALHPGVFPGGPSRRLLGLLLFPSSVLEDGVGLLRLLAAGTLLGQELIDLLDVGALAGPLNDPDKVTSVSSM